MSDKMLIGVLRMPYESAMADEISRRQFYARAQEAADRVEALTAQVEAAGGVEGSLDTHADAARDAARAYGPVHVVGDLVRNLLTLDQTTPIYSAFHVDYQGKRRCRTRPVSVSYERVIDGRWVDPARKDVPYAVIVWAKPKADEQASTPGSAGGGEQEQCARNWAIAEGVREFFYSNYPQTAGFIERPNLAEIIAKAPAVTALARPVQGVPEGWKLVPIEPTEDMVVQGFESVPDAFFSIPEEWDKYAAMTGCQQAAHRARLCYAAMLAAAPALGEASK